MTNAELAQRLMDLGHRLAAAELIGQDVCREAAARLAPAGEPEAVAREIVELWNASYCAAVGKKLTWLETDPLKNAITAALTRASASAMERERERLRNEPITASVKIGVVQFGIGVKLGTVLDAMGHAAALRRPNAGETT